MRDRLPDIRISSADPTGLAEKIATIAADLKAFAVVRHPDHPTPGDLIVALHTGRPSPHGDLSVHLVAQPKARMVAVEVRAAEWGGGGSPSYETYRSTAETLLKPLLAAYKEAEGTRLRMTITRKDRLEPKLSPWGGTLFRHFITHANIPNLHPHDWRRFLCVRPG